MKINQIGRIIIPLVLLLGAATTFFVATLGNQQTDTSIQGVNLFTSEAVSMNLYIEGIDGESDRVGRETSIDVLAYSHSIMNPDFEDLGRTAISVKYSPFRITKMIDKTSPKLYNASHYMILIPSVSFEVYHEPDNLWFLIIELQGALIISIQTYGLGEGRPTETVSFSYTAIKWTYKEYDIDGKAQGTVESGWLNWDGS
ncbi:MAG: Hcp family type VI secretion system effector [Candidatus Hodarchaeales archaeon]|jgi:type VI secretion system secreted protein Hcp